MEKKTARLRRAKRLRHHLKDLGVVRLTVHRSPRHIYAQVIGPTDGTVIAAAATVEPGVRTTLSISLGNKEAASVIGRLVAERALAKGVKKVGFDRSGFKYHGRVQALADAAREAGLQF